MFGPFVKLIVSFGGHEHVPTPRAPINNAFEVMMMAQRSMTVPVIPSMTSAHTNKDKLYSSLVVLFEQENLKLQCDDLNGKRLKALPNALWYNDGRHETLEKRSCKVPQIFSKVPSI